VDWYGYTPLQTAAVRGHNEVVKLLLETTGVRCETSTVSGYGEVRDVEHKIKDKSIIELIREKQRHNADKQN
jgi:ankyrin repeat protein